MARASLQPPSLGHPNTVDDPETAPFDHQIGVADVAFNYYNPLVLPPGFRFVPKDEELIFYYLYPFLHGYSLPNVDIHHVNIYNYNPTQLAARFKKGNDKDEWFFITERKKKFDGGNRPNCSANGGYWKATGTETKIHAGKGVWGSKRSLDFRIGKQPNGVKTDWIMQEYRLDRPLPNKKSHGDNKTLDIVLCKIYQTPMGKKRKAKEEHEENLPRVSPFNELASIFYPQQQETSRVGEDHSLNPNLEEGRGLFLGVSSMGNKRKTEEEKDYDDNDNLLNNNTHPLAGACLGLMDPSSQVLH
ncbi:unnamed protein product [Arabis nemorensis]|uniref:NAC domain-containing protein n=1 Tax=Arabis nemorensis TaxID=586526 RepID=A0A565BWX2_9BRAS|nr:unnamed protein product [Arabis nemorensis]